jgi:hypothetical protein
MHIARAQGIERVLEPFADFQDLRGFSDKANLARDLLVDP